MEFHPVEALKVVPNKVIEGLRELREVIVGPEPQDQTNEELSHNEQTRFYRSKREADVSAMSASINRTLRSTRKN